MDHHRRVYTVEDAGIEHGDLAAAALFGRRADDPHRESEILGAAQERDAGPHRRGGDQIVAAGVTDFGQRVVLSADAEDHRARARLGDEGGFHPGRAASNLEAGLGQRLCRPRAGPLLFEGQLGVVVDGAAELDKGVQPGVDGAGGGGLGRSDPRCPIVSTTGLRRCHLPVPSTRPTR